MDASRLYTFATEQPDAGTLTGVPVVVNLQGFVDAGQVGKLVGGHLREADGAQVLVRFDLDQVYDYRARRPVMDFDEDHWASFEAPTLELVLVRDTLGEPVLLLHGPEPDLAWERLTRAFVEVFDHYGAGLVVSVHGIPMAVPHTRPVSLTAHATRKDLVQGHRPWNGRVQVPGTLSALLELRLGEQGRDALGYAVHVPHYLSQNDYPDAAVTALEQVGALLHRTWDLEPLRVRSREMRAAVDEQVGAQPEVAAVVEGLESQYDAFLGATGRSLLAGSDDLPTAEELGAELERYLAEENDRRSRGDV